MIYILTNPLTLWIESHPPLLFCKRHTKIVLSIVEFLLKIYATFRSPSVSNHSTKGL